MTNDWLLEPGSTNAARLVVRVSHVTIDGRGATLLGPGRIGHTNSLADAGVGILIEGADDVVLQNIKAHGFATGLIVRHASAVSVIGCDFSDNYDNPKHGWGELPARGGILCEAVKQSVFQNNRAHRVWDGIHLVDSDDNLVADNDFSHCSNTAAKLWHSSRNKFLSNNLSYGIRIDRAAGEVHARDSTGVLIETGSNDNYWYRNDVTQGGDGIFIRPLNRWISRGNLFVENDTSYANNNCVESWSPGNTFIRNKANHGSYGFWLGGSDQTVLIGNEAAFNGLTNGNHNAPEPGFGHGGIVIVGGPSSHTVIDGNKVHDNNGAGIAFRGDVRTRGQAWQTEHWIVQRNQIRDNRFGLWGRWGRDILTGANIMEGNREAVHLTNVVHLILLPDVLARSGAPVAMLTGPTTVKPGQIARFDASHSSDPAGAPLQFHWWLDGQEASGPVLERSFDQPGFHRVSLTVENGSLGAMAWRDLLVVEPVTQELGTEGESGHWSYVLENDDGHGRMTIEDDPVALVGRSSLRFTPNPYPGAYATVLYPKTRDAHWNFSDRTNLCFWIKAENPNLPGFQNAGPVVRLIGPEGEMEFKPKNDANLLNDPPFSEARWMWLPVKIPLSGNATWEVATRGTVSLERIDALSLGLDSWGGDPFTVWLDGLSVQ